MGRRRRQIGKESQQGLTLVELLVTLLIVALSASVIVLNAPTPPGKEREAAEQFAAKLGIASQLSITSSTLIGLEVTETGYAFYDYRSGEWEPAGDRQLRPGEFSADVAVDIEIADSVMKNKVAEIEEEGGEEDTPHPSVFFSPTGEVTPLSATFATRRGARIVELTENAELEVRRGDS